MAAMAAAAPQTVQPPTIVYTATGTTTGTGTGTMTWVGSIIPTTTTGTAVNVQTATATKTVSAGGVVTAIFTGTKTGVRTSTASKTVAGTATWIATYIGTGTATGTKAVTGTQTLTGTVTLTGSLSMSATSTKSATGTKSVTGTAVGTGSKTVTQVYTASSTTTTTSTLTTTGTNTAIVTRTGIATATSTTTVTNPCYGTWAFCDNFETGNGSGWNVQQGPVQNFAVAGDGTKVYRESDATASQLYISRAQVGISWLDATAEVRLKPITFSSSSATVSLWGRYDATWNADCGYYVSLRGDGKLALGKRVAGVNTALGSAVAVPGGVSTGTWYDVKLDMQGTTLKAFVNGTQLLTQTDASCTSGSVGVGSAGASFEADDVRVTAPATNACVQGWIGTTCGAFCTGQTQSDRLGCGAYLDCYAAHGCSPETCGGQDDVCGVNVLNPWGTASKEVADQVYRCLGCAGSVNCANPKFPDWTVCADGNACTWGDTCQNKVCVSDPNRATQCYAADQCHVVGTCDTTNGTCSNPPKAVGSACDDGVLCTESDQCTEDATCVGQAKPCNLPPNAQCYDAGGSCADGTCTYTRMPEGTSCGDNDLCTENDYCAIDGTCIAGIAKQCNTPPDAQCQDAVGSCTGGSCAYPKKPNFTQCDDGNAETIEDSCQEGVCAGLFAARHILPADQADTVQSQLPGGFSVSADGAAQYAIPLDIPEGRAGISPKLALTYSSQGGNGMVGVGWNLAGAISQITHCPRVHAVDGEAYPVTMYAKLESNGSYTYYDRFCLDGDYLVAPDSTTISGSGLTEYRPEHNPTVRVTMRSGGSNGPSSFLVEYPDGKKATYDKVMQVMQVQALNVNHSNFDPTSVGASQSKYQAWFLSRVADPAGNAMTINYLGLTGCSVYGPCEVVPDTIQYTSFVTNGVVTTPALRKVAFGYSTRTMDTSNRWIAGVQLASTKLLKTVTVSGPNPTTLGTLWTYTLSYTNDSVTGRSLLHSVKQCDASGVCKPETTFEWEKGASTFTPHAIQYNPSIGPGVKIADFNGDGLPDLISGAERSMDLTVLIASKSTAGLSYDELTETGISGDLVLNDALADVTPIDVDGDGASELLVRQNEDGKQWLRLYRFNGTIFERMADDGNEVPNNIDRYVYVGDLDGDGLPELIRNVSGNWNYRKNTAGVLGPYLLLGAPKVGGGTIPIPAIREYNNYIGDLDGSGRSTILLMTGLAETDTRYGALNLTTTQNSANGVSKYASSVPWIARNGFGGQGKVMLDLNGDGMADAVEYPVPPVIGRSSTYFVNTGRGMVGGTPNFTMPLAATETIYADLSGHDIFIVMDVNQDGRDDIVSAPVHNVDELDNDQPLRVFLSNGTGLSESTTIQRNPLRGGGTINWGRSTTGGRFRSLDANGDGLADFMMSPFDGSAGGAELWLHDGKKADMITSFKNGSGSSVEVTYSPWETAESVQPAGCRYPVRCPKRGLWVVSDYHLDLHDGAEWNPEYIYTYDWPAMDMLGRGWLGFGKRSVEYTGSGKLTSFVRSNTYRMGTSYPEAFRDGTVKNEVLLDNGVLLTGETHNWHNVIMGNAAVPGHSFAYALTMSSYQESETADAGYGAITNFRFSTTDITYDSYANAYETAQRFGDSNSNISVVTHLNDVTNWILSPPTEVLSASAQDGRMVVRRTKYDYATELPRSLTKVTIEPDGDSSTHLEIGVTSWNKFSLPERVDAVDRAGTHRTASVQYDDLEGSQPVAMTNPLAQTAHVIYHKGLNFPIWQSDINGLETDIYYYPFGRLQSVVPPDKNTVTMSYTSPPAEVGGVLQVKSSRASGQVRSKVLDLLDRPISTSWLAMNGRTARTDVWYNDWAFMDKVRGVTIPYFTDDTAAHPYTWFTYDTAGRLQNVNAADGRVATVEYSGLKTTTIDPKGNKSYSIEDQSGRMKKNVSIMPASDVGGAREIATQYVWGPFSLLEQVVDASGNIVKTSYDTLGRVSTTTDPDRGNKTLTFDAFGNLVTLVDPKGTTTFTPDALGRTTQVVSPDGTATYAWDTAAHGKGALASSTSADGVEKTMTYNEISRVESETWKIEGESYALGIRYDGLGRPDIVSYPDVTGFSTFKTQYGYAANGDLVSLKDVPTGTDAARQFWKADDRDPSGRIKQESLGDGTQTTYGIDQVRGVLTGIATMKGATPLQLLGYDYDSNLNVKTRSDAIAGVSERFDYDALDRLHTWQEVGSLGWGVTYSHDDIGNLTGRSLLGKQGETESLTFEHSGVNAGPHAVTSSAWGAYGYDGKGNQISSPEGTIEYTAFNLPKSIVGTDSTAFKYDASGARVLKQSTVNSGTTIYAGGSYERRTVGTEKTHVFYLSASGRQIGQVLRKESDQTETVLYIHSDALGSSEVVTDATGLVVGQRRKYDPFGAPTDIALPKAFPGVVLMSSAVHRGFTGHEEDSETGLINMRGRIYNPRVGHFLTPDPFADILHPVGLDPYAYVRNNPLRYTDPSGFQFESDGYSASGVEVVATGSGPGTETSYTIGIGGESGGGMPAGGSIHLALLYSLAFDVGGWLDYPELTSQLSDGTMVLRLPLGGWVRSDRPGTVHFQMRDGSSGVVGLHEYLYQWTREYAVPYLGDAEHLRSRLGAINANPDMETVSNTVTPPLAVGGQSAASSHAGGGALTPFTKTPMILAAIPGGERISAQLAKDTEPRRPGESFVGYIFRMVMALSSPPGSELFPLVGVLKGGQFAGKVVAQTAQPASEQVARAFARQIEHDISKDARRMFHDMKIGGDRTLLELKQDAAFLYEEAGKMIPDWMR